MDILKVKIKNNQLKIKRNLGMWLICCVSIIAPRLNSLRSNSANYLTGQALVKSATLHIFETPMK